MNIWSTYIQDIRDRIVELENMQGTPGYFKNKFIIDKNIEINKEVLEGLIKISGLQ